MKKIAIKGNFARGEEIIKILESLGGINKLHLKGDQFAGYYYIENDNSINCKFHSYIFNEYDCYTLEEYEQKFLKTMEKIAIYGHRSRSKDVIKTLESLGGKNRSGHEGWNESNGYYVDENNYICCNAPKNIPKDYKLYTLEEYEQKYTNMEKIAIKGHSYQSQEIIQILESLGGLNVQKYNGNDPGLYYYINDKHHIDCSTDLGLPKEYIIYTLQEYKQNHTMENKRNIQIDLTTAKEWYSQGGDLRKVALQAFTESELNSLPKSWEEYCKINPYIDKDKNVFLRSAGIGCISYTDLKREEYPGIIPSKERAEQFLILNKLLQIRDYYNQGWKPNWNDCTDKYVIWSFENELHPDVSTYASSLFAFKSKEIRDTFFENFESDLELIKEFL